MAKASARIKELERIEHGRYSLGMKCHELARELIDVALTIQHIARLANTDDRISSAGRDVQQAGMVLSQLSIEVLMGRTALRLESHAQAGPRQLPLFGTNATNPTGRDDEEDDLARLGRELDSQVKTTIPEPTPPEALAALAALDPEPIAQPEPEDLEEAPDGSRPNNGRIPRSNIDKGPACIEIDDDGNAVPRDPKNPKGPVTEDRANPLPDFQVRQWQPEPEPESREEPAKIEPDRYPKGFAKPRLETPKKRKPKAPVELGPRPEPGRYTAEALGLSANQLDRAIRANDTIEDGFMPLRPVVIVRGHRFYVRGALWKGNHGEANLEPMIPRGEWTQATRSIDDVRDASPWDYRGFIVAYQGREFVMGGRAARILATFEIDGPKPPIAKEPKPELEAKNREANEEAETLKTWKENTEGGGAKSFVEFSARMLRNVLQEIDDQVTDDTDASPSMQSLALYTTFIHDVPCYRFRAMNFSTAYDQATTRHPIKGLTIQETQIEKEGLLPTLKPPTLARLAGAHTLSQGVKADQ